MAPPVDPPGQAPDPVEQATEVVRAYCGWHIAPSRQETLTLDGPGGNVLVLPSLHVTDLASVTEDGTTLDPATDYTWSAKGIVQRQWPVSTWPHATWSYPWDSTYALPWWTTTLRGLAVELTHGYEDWPLDLAGVIELVGARIEANPLGLEAQAVGPFSEKYAAGANGAGFFTGGDLAALAPYRLPGRP